MNGEGFLFVWLVIGNSSNIIIRYIIVLNKYIRQAKSTPVPEISLLHAANSQSNM